MLALLLRLVYLGEKCGIIVGMISIKGLVFPSGATKFGISFLFPLLIAREKSEGNALVADTGRTTTTGPCAAAILFLLFSPLLAASGPTKAERDRIIFKSAGVSVLAERADSPAKRSRGLMYRTSLGEKEAMIFYFDESAYHTFWMYNTRIPLTVIFLDEGLKVVDMKNMSPCPEKNSDLCPIYASQGLARYAIEVNQGFVGKYSIKIGDRVAIERAYGR
jgi:uncharacterized membrane protein (UPF0127 family)